MKEFTKRNRGNNNGNDGSTFCISWIVLVCGNEKVIAESLEELEVKAKVEEILIDSDEKAKRYEFTGSQPLE